MELFIPSLIVLLLGALVCFFILPRMSPYVLGSLAVTMFGLGIWQHYSMFPYEYKASMATNILKQYSGFIMLLGVIFAAVVGVLMMHGGNPPAAGDMMPELPAMPNFAGSNNSKSIFNLGGNSNNSKNGIMSTVTNMMKPANNSKKNNLVSPSFKTV